MDPNASAKSLTLLLESVGGGDRSLDDLVPLVYDDLRRMAKRQLARERSSHTLCTMGLVNEAYIRLLGDEQITARGRTYFFAAAAQAMRRVLVEHARARSRQKRGGGVELTSMDGKEVPTEDLLAAVLEMDGALQRLGELSERQARVVECRVFAGLDIPQTAEALGASESTVKRDWALARAWLYRELAENEAL
ncbi:MAG: ECF-type sigma factor [Pseudomonadota bacterium]